MSKLGFELPDELENCLKQYIPWGIKGAVITELIWQFVESAAKDPVIVDDIIQAVIKRDRRT